MWTGQVLSMLEMLVRRGRLEVVFPDGTARTFGPGRDGPDVAVRLTDAARLRHLLTDPEMALGEAYMDGTLTIERGDLHGFLTLLVLNGGRTNLPPLVRAGFGLRRALRPLAQANARAAARRNVTRHYDLGDDFYDLFLDADRQYSCAYFLRPGLTLEEAQQAKKDHIAAKLLIQPGMRVLDIGCGWGGMALTLARDHGARVLGVTLSEEQLGVARARAKAEGLDDRVEFRLTDYRAIDDTFDRIVSVGMFEHVGAPQFETYFRKVHDMLAPDGVALIHTIGRTTPPGVTSAWIAKHIFPGGYVPALSEMMAAVEHQSLETADVEIWRLHYAETLRHWHDRFVANQDAARELYDERFCRMWRFYLLSSELTFRHGHQVVFQVQLAHRKDAVPITRDYLYRDDAQALRHAAE